MPAKIIMFPRKCGDCAHFNRCFEESNLILKDDPDRLSREESMLVPACAGFKEKRHGIFSKRQVVSQKEAVGDENRRDQW